MKLVNQRIWNETANGFAFDVGTQYRIGIEDLTIGMSMSNFGPDMKYDGRDLSVQYDGSTQLPENRLTPAQLAAEDYPLPLYFQVGVSMTVVNSEGFKMHVAADAAHPNDNKERVERRDGIDYPRESSFCGAATGLVTTRNGERLGPA